MSKKSINTKIVIEELHRAFKLFNTNLFRGELPEPAILIQSQGNRKNVLGWCTVGKVWVNDETQEERYEINIVAEHLNRGILPVMTTLLHELIHLYDLVNEVKDVSRNGTYHNDKFKATAEAHGLICTHSKSLGWSQCELTQYVIDLIKQSNFDSAVFSLGRKGTGEGTEEKQKKKSSVRKYVCPCCQQIIRATKEVNVICGDCFEIRGEVVKFKLDEPAVKPDDETPETPETEPVEVAPVEEPASEVVNPEECACQECGTVHLVPAGESMICPDCNGELKRLHGEPVAPPSLKIEQIAPDMIEEYTEYQDRTGAVVPFQQIVVVGKEDGAPEE